VSCICKLAGGAVINFEHSDGDYGRIRLESSLTPGATATEAVIRSTRREHKQSWGLGSCDGAGEFQFLGAG